MGLFSRSTKSERNTNPETMPEGHVNDEQSALQYGRTYNPQDPEVHPDEALACGDTQLVSAAWQASKGRLDSWIAATYRLPNVLDELSPVRYRNHWNIDERWHLVISLLDALPAQPDLSAPQYSTHVDTAIGMFKGDRYKTRILENLREGFRAARREATPAGKVLDIDTVPDVCLEDEHADVVDDTLATQPA